MRETDFGPLWEGDPKPQGFQLIIPEPHILFDDLEFEAGVMAEWTPAEQIQERDEQLAKFVFGESSSLYSGVKSWSVAINDQLLESIQFAARGVYHPEDGPRGDINAHMWLSDTAMTQELQWEIPSKGNEIASHLRAKSIGVSSIHQNTDGVVSLNIPSDMPGADISFNLGFRTLELSQAQDYQEDTSFVNCALGFDISIQPFTHAQTMLVLGRVQNVFPHIVDSVYQLYEMQPPNVQLTVHPDFMDR